MKKKPPFPSWEQWQRKRKALHLEKPSQEEKPEEEKPEEEGPRFGLASNDAKPRFSEFIKPRPYWR